MRKIYVLISVLLMAGLMITTQAFAAENHSHKSMNKSSNSSMQNSKNISNESQTFRVSSLIGKTVKDERGKRLGKVSDIILSRDGHADFVVLSRGGIISGGGKYVPVPFKTFMSDTKNFSRVSTRQDLTTRLSKAKLDAAPSFARRDLSGKSMHDKVCAYYGAGSCRVM